MEVLLSWTEFTQFQQELIHRSGQTSFFLSFSIVCIFPRTKNKIEKEMGVRIKNDLCLPPNVPPSCIIFTSLKDMLFSRRKKGKGSKNRRISRVSMALGKSQEEMISIFMEGRKEQNLSLIEEFKIRGYLLYIKYIKSGNAEYEINISFGQRRRISLLVNSLFSFNLFLRKVRSVFLNRLGILGIGWSQTWN